MVKSATHAQMAAEGLHLGGSSRGKIELPEEIVRKAIYEIKSGEDLVDLIIQYVKDTRGELHRTKVRSLINQLYNIAYDIWRTTTNADLRMAARFLQSQTYSALLLVDNDNTWNQFRFRHDPTVQKAEQEAARAAQAQSTTTQPAQATQQPAAPAQQQAAPAQQAAASKPTPTTGQTSKATQQPAAPAAPAAPAPQSQPNVQPTQPAIGTSQYTVTAPAIQQSVAATSPGTIPQPALLVTTRQGKIAAILQDAPQRLRDILAKARNVNILEVNDVSSLLQTGSAKTPQVWVPLKWQEDQRRIGFVSKEAKQQFIKLLQQHGMPARNRTLATPSVAPVAAPQTAPVATPKAAQAAAPQTAPVATPKAAPAAAQQIVPAATPPAAPAAAQQAAAQTAAAITQAAAPSRWQQLRTRLQQMRGSKIWPVLAIIAALTGAYAIGYHKGQQTSQSTTLPPDLTQWLQQSTTADEQLRARQQAYWNNLFRNLLLNQMQLYRTGKAPLPELPEAE
jgi:hypothetical protein